MKNEQNIGLQITIKGVDIQIKTISELENVIKNANKQLKETETVGTASYKSLSNEIALAQSALNRMNQEHRQTIKNFTDYREGVTNMADLRAQTNGMVAAANAFRVGIDGDSKALENMVNQININKTKIKEFEASMNMHQSNVGNYPEPQTNGMVAAANDFRVGIDGDSKALENMHQSNVGNYPELGEGFGALAGVAGAFGIGFGISAAVEGVKKSIEAYNEAQLAAERLKSTLDNLWNDGGEGFKALSEDAEQFSKSLSNVYRPDELMEGQQILALYGLQKNTIEQLMPVMADLAAQQKISIPQAAEILTKAIEGQGRALKGMGIEVLKTNTSQENLDIIMTKLAPKVKGMAETFSASEQGGWTKIGNDLTTNVLEPVGEFFSTLGQGLADGIEDTFDFSKWENAFQTTSERAAKYAKVQMDKAFNDFQKAADFHGGNSEIWSKLNEQQKKDITDYRKLLGESPLLTINGLTDADLEKLNAARAKEYEANKKRLDEAKKFADEKANFIKKVADYELKANNDQYQVEITEENTHYGEMLDLAKKYGVDDAGITEAHKSKIYEINQKWDDKYKKQAEEYQAKLDEEVAKTADENDLPEWAKNFTGTQSELAVLMNNTTNKTGVDPKQQEAKDKADQLNQAWHKSEQDMAIAAGNTLVKIVDESYANQTKAIEKNLQNQLKAIDINKQRELLLYGQTAAARTAIELKYQQETQKAEADAAAKKKEIAREEFATNQAFSVAKIIFSTAEAVMKDTAQFGAVLSVPFVTKDIALGALELAAVLAQKAPQAALGMEVFGNSHAQGGVLVETEGGELILNKNVSRNPFLKSIASAINVSTGGIPFSPPSYTGALPSPDLGIGNFGSGHSTSIIADKLDIHTAAVLKIADATASRIDKMQVVMDTQLTQKALNKDIRSSQLRTL